MNQYRRLLMSLCVLAALTTAGSFVSQYGFGLNPCPLCILQRLAVMATGLTAALALLLPSQKSGGRTAAAVLVSVPAIWGLGVALYQIYVQSLPIMEQPACGAPWTFRLRDWPLFDWYEAVIRGSGQCGVVEKVAGVPLPMWSAMFFGVVLLMLGGLWLRLRQA
ncbi:MAG: disulfide bond formation protein B [Neisseria sp.]